jgi:hypothetical protein
MHKVHEDIIYYFKKQIVTLFTIESSQVHIIHHKYHDQQEKKLLIYFVYFVHSLCLCG